MAKSVIILGIDWKYIDAVSGAVATSMNKMFLSIKDLIVYELQGLIGNMNNVDNQYINNRIREVKIGALEYEDSIISIDASNINDKDFENAISGLTTIYVEKKCDDDKFASVYDDRHKILTEIADVVVHEADFDSQVKKIIEIVSCLN
ncbi:MAG: hypothetical protein IJZ29_02685 [Clostridia bacterium]|nr:hypothetical protein [Clostridia bacterium]